MNDVVRLETVTKTFDGFVAVKRLSLAVERGEFLTLLGSSGCGKTTTLRLINGFELADDGEIYIDGRLVNAIPPYQRNVNTVFQNYALFPHLNIFDNVAYGLSIRRVGKSETRRRVLEMLERVGLVDKVDSNPSQLSGGQMQRVALARALINEPPVLLLDEPLGALDARLRRAMQLELKRMHSELGITFIYVTHDQEEAFVMSDRIVVMDRGEVRQIGSPAEIFDSPANPFVAEFVGTTNFFDAVAGPMAGDGREVQFGSDHRLVARQAADVGEGARITISVRPQRIQIRAPSVASGSNLLAGRLKEIIYLGTAVRFVVELGNGVVMQAENGPEHLPFDFRRLQPGERIDLHVPSSAVLVYGGRT
jgi:spermidine/putrescine transport system ATP-binding protein